MIKSIDGLSKRFFKANKSITISCIFAIALSTILIICLMNFSVNSKDKLKKDMLDKFGNFDILCGYNESSQKMNEGILKDISFMDEIEYSSPAIVNYTKINNDIDAYTIGVENDDLSKSRYKYSEDLQEDTVIVNEQLAETLDLKVGSMVSVDNNQKKVIEIFKDETYNSNSLNMAIVKRNELKEILRYDGEADFVMVKAKSQNDIPKAAAKLSNLDNNLRVEEFQEDEGLKNNIDSMMYFIKFLGALVFIMCGLFIMSNFQGYIYKYTKDFAIIKAIGGSAKQVFITVLLQTLRINLIGISSGLVISILIYKIFLRSFRYYIMPSLQIALYGFALIQVILLIPSFKTARILPIKAMEKNNNTRFKKTKFKRNIMIGTFILGAGISLYSIIVNDFDSFRDGIIGFLCIYFSTFLFLLLYLNDILKCISKVFKAILGKSGILALKMLEYKVKKNSILIFSITTMITITVIGQSFVRLIEKNNGNYYRSQYLTDIVLTSDKEFTFEELLDMYNDINNIDNTTASFIAEQDWTQLRMDKNSSKGTYILGSLDTLMDQGLINRFNNPEKNVVVNKEYADKNNISVGDKIKFIPVYYEKKRGVIYDDIEENEYEYDLEVGDIEDSEIIKNADVLIDISNSDMAYKNSARFEKMYISSENKNIDTFLKNEKLKYNQIKWSTLDDVLDKTTQGIEDSWKYFEISLIIISCIILIGLIISIKGDINSNRKQYAILRCMKITQKDLAKIILTQDSIFMLIGQILGLIMGTIGSIIVSLSDGGRTIALPDYKALIFICIISVMLILICILPDINMIKRQKLVDELVKEEL